MSFAVSAGSVSSSIDRISTSSGCWTRNSWTSLSASTALVAPTSQNAWHRKISAVPPPWYPIRVRRRSAVSMNSSPSSDVTFSRLLESRSRSVATPRAVWNP